MWLRLWLDWWQESLVYDCVNELKCSVLYSWIVNMGVRMEPRWFWWVIVDGTKKS